jgi:hypothetical protein
MDGKIERQPPLSGAQRIEKANAEQVAQAKPQRIRAMPETPSQCSGRVSFCSDKGAI